MTAWNIITGHYPPQAGGVSDYTRLVAERLVKAGDRVTVWSSHSGTIASDTGGVCVNRLPDHFGRRGLAMLDRELRRAHGTRVLLEYVPHAFGMRAMNVPLCVLLLRSRRQDLTVMFHEVAYPVERGQRWRHNAIGIVNRAMAAILARASSRIFVAAEAWKVQLARYAPRGAEIGWLPVPSNIQVADRSAIFEERESLAKAGAILVGHFGTYGPLVADRLKPVLKNILADRADARAILIGRNSDRFRDTFIGQHPQLAARVMATGGVPAPKVSACIGACDLLIQPYPDGITSRNASALTGLEHGRPIATTVGRFTENFWQRSGAVMLAPDNDADALARGAFELMENRERAEAMGCAALKLYREVFDVQHTIDALRAA